MHEDGKRKVWFEPRSGEDSLEGPYVTKEKFPPPGEGQAAGSERQGSLQGETAARDGSMEPRCARGL